MDIKKYEIDSETGLPTLPEGYRWFVSDKIRAPKDDPAWGCVYFDGFVFSPTRLRVVLQKRHEKLSINADRNPKKHWWNREPGFIDRLDVDWKISQQEETDGISAAAVSAAAAVAYGRFVDARAADDLRNSLVGAYPPKKLEV